MHNVYLVMITQEKNVQFALACPVIPATHSAIVYAANVKMTTNAQIIDRASTTPVSIHVSDSVVLMLSVNPDVIWRFASAQQVLLVMLSSLVVSPGASLLPNTTRKRSKSSFNVLGAWLPRRHHCQLLK